MTQKAKFFRVAVEGNTIDGRKIERQWIADSAETYDTRVYTSQINIEHIRGYFPDSTFRRYGKVLAVKADEIKEGSALDGKLALYAQIEPLPDLVELTNKMGQKLFTSCEFVPNFANTGKCYVTGIAATDDPASLGTEALKFSASGTGAFRSSVLEIDNPFRQEEDMTFAEFLAAMREGFSKTNASQNTTTASSSEPAAENVATAGVAGKPAEPEDFSDIFTGIQAMATSNKTLSEQVTKLSGQVTELATLKEKFATLEKSHADLVQKLSSQEAAGSGRQTATGAPDDLPDFM